MHYPASRSLSAASSLSRGKRLPVSLTGLASMILPGIISRRSSFAPFCGTPCCPVCPVLASS